MKKLIFLIPVVILAIQAQAQLRVGVQASPVFTINRINSLSDTASFSPDGARLRLAIGPVFDFFIRENYYFSTGILYVPKIAGFDVNLENSNQRLEEMYNTQYMRIPLTLRLFTNEVSIDRRFYVQFGLTADIRIHQEPNDKDNILVNNFTLFDGSALIGFGLEQRIGFQTSIYGGFSYSRGLVNTIDEHINLDEDLKSRNDIFSIDLGIFF